MVSVVVGVVMLVVVSFIVCTAAVVGRGVVGIVVVCWSGLSLRVCSVFVRPVEVRVPAFRERSPKKLNDTTTGSKEPQSTCHTSESTNPMLIARVAVLFSSSRGVAWTVLSFFL